MSTHHWTIIAQAGGSDAASLPSYFADTSGFDLHQFKRAPEALLSEVLSIIVPSGRRGDSVPINDLIAILETKPAFFFAGLLPRLCPEFAGGVAQNLPRWTYYEAGNAVGIAMDEPAEFIRFGIKFWSLRLA